MLHHSNLFSSKIQHTLIKEQQEHKKMPLTDIAVHATNTHKNTQHYDMISSGLITSAIYFDQHSALLLIYRPQFNQILATKTWSHYQ